jgi:hypothetical protein
LRSEGILPSLFAVSHASAGETPAGRKGKMPSLREDAIALVSSPAGVDQLPGAI